MTWRQRANCRGLPASWWYSPAPVTPESMTNLRKARRLCLSCEVRAECLDDGMDERYGIWGGLSPKQRIRIKRGRA
jgi:WhiB family redox-sensing transcriptional regulator